VGIPIRQVVDVGSYIVKQHLTGKKRYPLVLMLEPLFRCNLACAGCGKIDYPDEILNKRISVDDALGAVDECGAPVVVMAGGEPLIHKDLPKIVQGIIARKKYAIVCTNALLLEKKIDEYKPSPYFTWSIHLDGDKEMHDKSVCKAGVYEKAVDALKLAKEKGFRVTINCTFFNDADPERIARFFDTVTELGVDGITVSPGYAYERAPDQKHFLNRAKTKDIFRNVFKRGNGGKKWAFNQSGHVPRLPGRQPDLQVHSLGQPDPDGLRLAEALLPSRRGLRLDVQGADGRHELGQLRRRELREVRRLHGAFRVRGDRREGHGSPPVGGREGRPFRDQDRRSDGARNPARSAASGRVRLLAQRPEEAVRDPGREGLRSGSEGRERGLGAGRRSLHPGRSPLARVSGEDRAGAIRRH
jgi:hopanoid biosynthesis associated radical SAM protein HpnH